MNHPCKIYFHEDTAPLYGQLPDRYKAYVCDPDLDDDDPVVCLLSQNAFFIDFTNGSILRTRVGGHKEEDPIDFPISSIAWIEWYYGSNAPAPLTATTYPGGR